MPSCISPRIEDVRFGSFIVKSTVIDIKILGQNRNFWYDGIRRDPMAAVLTHHYLAIQTSPALPSVGSYGELKAQLGVGFRIWQRI